MAVGYLDRFYGRPARGTTAGCKPAIQQIANLRYGVQLCAPARRYFQGQVAPGESPGLRRGISPGAIPYYSEAQLLFHYCEFGPATPSNVT